jgi:hypothetical protein
MARKKEPEAQPEKPVEKQLEAESVIVSAAKAIGSTAGKIAAMAGAHTTPPRPKIGKLAAKNKSRLPRKQKKAQQKLAAASRSK